VTRGDSELFPFSCGNKGVGFLPRAGHLPEFLELYRSTMERTRGLPWRSSLDARLEAVARFQLDREAVDRRCLGTLEIFEKATFRNLQRHPSASLLFTGSCPVYTSFQLNCGVEILGEGDPRLEFLRLSRALFEYDGFHIAQPRFRHAYLFWIVEVVDKTPYRVEPPTPGAPGAPEDGLLGSTATRVLRRATCDGLVARHATPRRGAGGRWWWVSTAARGPCLAYATPCPGPRPWAAASSSRQPMTPGCTERCSPPWDGASRLSASARWGWTGSRSYTKSSSTTASEGSTRLFWNRRRPRPASGAPDPIPTCCKARPTGHWPGWPQTERPGCSSWGASGTTGSRVPTSAPPPRPRPASPRAAFWWWVQSRSQHLRATLRTRGKLPPLPGWPGVRVRAHGGAQVTVADFAAAALAFGMGRPGGEP